MKAYVLTDVKEQAALMDIINSLTDEQKELIVKFGGEMNCHGYISGYNDGCNDMFKGTVATAIGFAIGGIIYIAWMCHKSKKKKIEVEAE